MMRALSVTVQGGHGGTPGSHRAEIRAADRATQKAVTCETIECGRNRIRQAGLPRTAQGFTPPSARTVTNTTKIGCSGRTRRSRAAAAENTSELAVTDSDRNHSHNGQHLQTGLYKTEEGRIQGDTIARSPLCLAPL